MLILVIGCSNKELNKGFTLVEILVALIIIGITTTLITLNFSSLSSVTKQVNTIEDNINFLTEESIVTGNIIGWYFNANEQYAAYLLDEDKQKIIKDLNKSSWVDTQSLKKTFKFLDGTKIELGEKEYKTPLLIFYPSGENSGGIIDIYYEEYIQRIVINNNGKINNEVVNY